LKGKIMKTFKLIRKCIEHECTYVEADTKEEVRALYFSDDEVGGWEHDNMLDMETELVEIEEIADDGVTVLAEHWVGENGEFVHRTDSDCALDDNNGCTVCHVYHGDPCPSCGKRAFHADRCPNA
jgi:hypothetical protein